MYAVDECSGTVFIQHDDEIEGRWIIVTTEIIVVMVVMTVALAVMSDVVMTTMIGMIGMSVMMIVIGRFVL